MKNEMSVKDAFSTVKPIINELSPNCSIINIAGSLRRKMDSSDYKSMTVGDIEICCLPLKQKVPSLFPGEGEPEFSVQGFSEQLNKLGNVLKGNADGRYMQIHLHQGINLDIFMPQKHDYYRQYAIRTGPTDYAYRTIASAWRKLGWVGTEQGLRRESESRRYKDTTKWICDVKRPVLPPSWENEEDFFIWLKVPYVTPSKRF